MGRGWKALLTTLSLALAPAAVAHAETLLKVDAGQAAAEPETGYLKTGTLVSPSGHAIGINSQYLTLDGKPWLPVMGEFHYTRYPPGDWDQELAKMKAAGVQVVSTYIIWIHHEETPGSFNWSGDRDLRRFVELCARHGLYVMVRLGPWVHAEVRYGGVPDWVVQSTRLRSNDPAYLSYVERYYDQIGAQLKGLMWKDGGPIIGVQLDNEYNLTGEGQGREHIARLKQLALKAGFDAPLYTVTGWDNTVYPRGEVTPVLGGYPDMPWDTAVTDLPPSETYVFRFDNRINGGLGTETASTGKGDAAEDVAHTPFLTAEYGAGMGPMYRRRTTTSADDGAALLPVQIGSGVNMMGYYMFHGGRNPDGRTMLEESTAIGGYNDLPLINYDLGAPIGQYGQAHAVLAKLRPWHLFLEDFGAELAPMTPRKPEVTPSRPDDLTTPRFAVRSKGDSGFLFVSDYIRLHPMAAQRQVRFEVRLPSETLRLPSRPVDIASGAYFVWPLNLDLAGVRLAWATAQPTARIESADGPVYVFRAVDGIAPELAFAKGARVRAASGHTLTDAEGRTVVRDLKPGLDAAVTLTPPQGPKVRILVLDQAQAERLWRVEFAGRPRLLLTDAEVAGEGERLELRSKGEADVRFSLFPAPTAALTAQQPVRSLGREGLFVRYEARLPERNPQVTFTSLRAAQPVPPLNIGGTAKAAIEPYPETWAKSAAWTLSVDPAALDGLSEAYLQLDWRGDTARLFSGPKLIDDQYYAGGVWEVGLKRFSDGLGQPLTLTVLPLRKDAPIYLQAEARAKLPPGDQAAELASVRIVPEYALSVTAN